MGVAGTRALRLPGRLAAALAAGAGAVALLAGAAAHDAPRAVVGQRAAPPPARAYDGLLAGVPLQRARCRNWRAAAPGPRRDAVRALTATIGGASTTGGVGTTLSDSAVTALFDRVCATPATSGFALYLIYARAAAFSRTHVTERGPS